MATQSAVWPDPNSDGWIDAWNGWYPTERDARADAAPAVAAGLPWDLTYGEGLISEDELAARRAEPVRAIAARKRAGIDNDQDESAVIKRYFNRYTTEAEAEQDDLAGLFPLEFAEWCAELDHEAICMSNPTWPETDAERDAFADWQYEVGNGDTLRGFRDWLASNLESDSP